MKLFKLTDLPDIDTLFWRKWFLPAGATYRRYCADIERGLQIKKRAADDGRNNLPATDDTEPSVIEHQIKNRFDTNSDALKQALFRGQKGYLDRIIRCIPESLDFKAIADATEIAINRIRDRARAGLIALRKYERDRQSERRGFQVANDLKHRSASYPLPWPMKPLFFVILGVVVESILNGAFFAERSPEYWQGGVFQALGFSVVNILLGCVLLGLIAARYANHVKPWKRYAGIAGIVFALFAGAMWNGYVAHYRALLETVPLDKIDALADGSYLDAFSHMRDHPFDLASWQAVVLFVLGVAIFLVMAKEGYRADDVYPRYGHTDRSYKNALRAYETAKAKLVKAVEAEIDKITKQLKRRIDDDARKVARARKLLNASEAFHREIADSAADLVRACTASLQTYRETNSFVRTTPAPAYFKTYPVFAVELPESTIIATRYEEAVAKLDSNRKAANEIGHHLNEVAKSAVEDFIRYIDDVETEVARQVETDRVPLAAE